MFPNNCDFGMSGLISTNLSGFFRYIPEKILTRFSGLAPGSFIRDQRPYSH